MNRLLAMLVATVLTASGLTAVLTAPAQASGAAAERAFVGVAPRKVVKRHLRSAIRHLPVRKERRRGYDRDRFRMWTDADHDCRDTRAEVLAAESRTRTRGHCTIRTGKWRSYYDRTTFRRASQLDIDHMVPLAEAWDSGARRWSAGTRERYANDLGDRRTLVAVSAHSNRSKGDRDPAEWMPAYGGCRYVGQWVAVKIRWRLSVDRAERRALLRTARHCKNVVVTVRHAKVVKGKGGATSGSGGGTTSGSGTGGGAGLDPQFDTCTDAKAHGYGPYVQGKDPEYPWYIDGDDDGVVCE